MDGIRGDSRLQKWKHRGAFSSFHLEFHPTLNRKMPNNRLQIDNRRLKERKFDNNKKELFSPSITRKNHSYRQQQQCIEESWWQQWPPFLRHYSLLPPPPSLEPTCKPQHFHPSNLWLALGFSWVTFFRARFRFLKSTPRQSVARTLVLLGDVLWRGISNSLPPICGLIWVCWVTLSGARSWIPSPCNLWVRLGLFWVTFFGASFDSIPSNLWLALWFCWVNVLWSDFGFPPLHICGYHFWFWWVPFFEANFNSITSNFVSRTLILLILERFWISTPPIWVHILVLMGEYSLERVSNCNF